MRKILIHPLICTLILCLLCASAAAESALAPFYDAQRTLLTATDNVTLNAGVNFLLDGESFKQMTISQVQSGKTSLRHLIMATPLEDGGERISGFTVFANGTDVYAFESADAESGEYLDKTFEEAEAKTTLLRRRPMTDSLAEIGRALLPALEASLDAEVFHVTESDGCLALHLICDENSVPAGLDSLLTMAFRYAVSLYTSIGEYFIVNYTDAIAPWQFVTTSDGLIWCAESISLKSAEISVSLDEEGRLVYAGGTLIFRFRLMNDEEHEVRTEIYESAEDYGVSTFDSYDPNLYNIW